MNRLNIIQGIKLSDCEPGSHVIIDKISGGDKLRDKLFSMGILPGKDIEILSLRKRGPVIVKVNETRLVIGHGMALKILVIPSKG
jgi:ferrous iron transport protein A